MRFESVSMPDLPDVVILSPQAFHDDRGWFLESFRASAFEEMRLPGRFVQDNHSYSGRRGTLRGLHYQLEPAAQGKLVRCLAGRIFDVVVDIRAGSPTYGRWGGQEMSADDQRMIWVPPGFAHGFQTMTDDTQIFYKVTREYSPDHERVIRWDDAAIGIGWPVEPPILSDRDASAPGLADAENNFTWGDAS